MSLWLLLWILVWTILAFALMGIDKWKAKRGAWRVPGKGSLFLGPGRGKLGGPGWDGPVPPQDPALVLSPWDAGHPDFAGGGPAPLVLARGLVSLSGKMPKGRGPGGRSSHSLTT